MQHLGEILSQQVKAREDAETHRRMLSATARREELLGILSKAGVIDLALFENLPELGSVLPADGAAVLFGDRVGATHRAPSQEQVRDLVGWLLDTVRSGVFETGSLVGQYAPAAEYAREASGLLATVVSREEPVVLLWFRAEQLETINWAGNPHTPVEPSTAIGTLNPRKSFEIWKETVHNRSEPWSAAEVEAARNLGRSLFELLQKQKVTELNAQLSRSLADKEALLRQKDFLMREVNHRVQNSLQLVNAMLTLQAEEARDEQVRAQFGSASDRILAIAMVHRRLWQTDHIQSVDFALYLKEIRDGLVETWGSEWGNQVTVQGGPIVVSTDTAVVLALVIIELLTNAVKYAYGGSPGPIDVSMQQTSLGLDVVVKDRGVGMPIVQSKQGLGSQLTRGMVDELNGELTIDSSTQGTSIVIRVPLGSGSQ